MTSINLTTSDTYFASFYKNALNLRLAPLSNYVTNYSQEVHDVAALKNKSNL